MLSLRRAGSLAGSLALAACSESPTPATLPVARPFAIVAAEPASGSQLLLNQPIAITCSDDVDLATVDFTAVRFTVTDYGGNPVGEQPRGTFRLRAPDNRRVLEFTPALGTSRHDGGLRLSRRYIIDLAANAPATLRSARGRPLEQSVRLEFTTPEIGATQVFLDPLPGRGPRLRSARATPQRGEHVVLGEQAGAPVEVLLEFDQPLDPSPANVPTALDPSPARIDPRAIDAHTKGRIYLEYDDPVFGPDTWIPATVTIAANDNAGCQVVLMPVGVLPNAARVRVIVEPTLRDLAGEDNQRDAAYPRAAFGFTTEPAPEPRFAALVETFDSAEHLDFDAAVDAPLAELGPGYLQAAATPFDGRRLDYRPRQIETLLNTDVTEVTAEGRTVTVTGGVFHFRNVTIPRGASVRGIGTKPMVWIVEGDFDIAGTLSLDGGDAQGASRFGGPSLSPAGMSVCGGGRGGRGSPSETARDLQGEDGFGPFQTPGGGGRGGAHSCALPNCIRGGGGGGGSFATAGDPHHPSAMFRTLPRVGLGAGGAMCVPMTGPQAPAGPPAFTDQRRDNDFFGRGIDAARQLGIAGELQSLRGGSGGGGGGDTGACGANGNFRGDQVAGGGGGGGGALLVQVRGRIILRQTGQLRADGGYGGGGTQAGSNSNCGGGGGGSGGMIVLMAGEGIHIAAHGSPYAYAEASSAANGAYEFAISADGGTGRRSAFQGNPVTGKYPGRGGTVDPALWDASPIGGFGGLGLVQLMAPAGENLALAQGGDGTATRLDDHVYLYRDDAALERGLRAANPHAEGGGALTGESKTLYLGWRGMRDEQGIGRDDAGNVVSLPRDDHGEGDIRPAPILLPSPVGPLSRARSRWLDLGAAVRRADADGPRHLREHIDPDAPDDPTRSFRAGPSFAFAATHDGASGPAGYARTREAFGNMVTDAPAILPAPVAIADVATTAHDGAPAYAIRLQTPAPLLAQREGRYAGYRAELAAADQRTATYRILTHRGDVVVVSAEAEPMLERAVTLQVRAEFFGVARGPNPGFGEPLEEAGRPIPASNVRIGFAFHVDPTRQRAGVDPLRLPADSREFLFGLDLARPDLLREVSEFAQRHAATRGTLAVQWDVTFNTAYSERTATGVAAARREVAERALRLQYLTIPFQY